MSSRKIVVVGYGSRFGGDAEAGAAVLSELSGRVPRDVELQTLVPNGKAGDPEWNGCERGILIHTIPSLGAPGTIHVWRAKDIPERLIPHLQLSRDGKPAPESLLVVGIEAAMLGGDGMSEDVTRGVHEAADWILQQLAVQLAP